MAELTDKKTTKIHFILDKSGSMSSVAESTISAFNEYISSLKRDKNRYRITLTLFDTNVQTLWENEDLKDVVKLSHRTYMPWGNTALYDAVCSTLSDKSQSKAKNLVVIMTDGEENSSQEYSEKDFKSLKSKLEEKGNWTFVFMGANQDVWANASKWGFARGNTTVFNATDSGLRMASINMAHSTTSFAGASGSATASFYSEKQQDENEKTK